MPQDTVVVFVTASSDEEAETIARAVVEERLVACANVVPGVTALFRWQGKIERESEVLIIMKTRGLLLEGLIARVKDLHSYETPEIIAVPIVGGSREYLDWVKEETEAPPRGKQKDRRGPFGLGF
ncbi:MAG: divalent-cation tolerance protein CutA [Candidatus Eisenbacteria sp.]|nr:divalent-cation tolerance protein CutA [Candidatus Eisenbacteria bacterium]